MALQVLSDEPSWTAFLVSAGVPATEATYATIFMDNRINQNTLSDITADHLRLLNITVLGDILAILKHGKTLITQTPALPDYTQQSTATSDSKSYRPPPAAVKLPNITPEMTIHNSGNSSSIREYIKQSQTSQLLK